jgi:hypothetical protein
MACGLGLAPMLGACFPGPAAKVQQLRARASFEMQCSAKDLRVVDMDEQTKGVEGCGRRLTYVEMCDERPDGWHCTWVINSPPCAVGPPLSRQSPPPAESWWFSRPSPAEVQPAAPGYPLPYPSAAGYPPTIGYPPPGAYQAPAGYPPYPLQPPVYGYGAPPAPAPAPEAPTPGATGSSTAPAPAPSPRPPLPPPPSP